MVTTVLRSARVCLLPPLTYRGEGERASAGIEGDDDEVVWAGPTEKEMFRQALGRYIVRRILRPLPPAACGHAPHTYNRDARLILRPFVGVFATHCRSHASLLGAGGGGGGGAGPAPQARWVCVHGPPGSGKTHRLLHTCHDLLSQVYIPLLMIITALKLYSNRYCRCG